MGEQEWTHHLEAWAKPWTDAETVRGQKSQAIASNKEETPQLRPGMKPTPPARESANRGRTEVGLTSHMHPSEDENSNVLKD